MTSELVDYNFQLHELLTSSPPAIAFDVTYKVLDSEGKLEGEVSGHKFLLALASPVFRRGFYGTDFKEKKSESIEMKGTTLKAFEALISVIYRRPLDLENMTVTETFDLMNLAERYDLPKLKNKLMQEFETMVLSKDNVVKVANTAMKFCQLEEACEALLLNCAKTLLRDLKTQESVFRFCSSAYGSGNEMLVLKLMSMTSNLLPPPCSKFESAPCEVTGEEDETVLYSHCAKLYRLVEGEWEVCGVGNVKILEHKACNRVRLFMRTEQVLKICLNHRLSPALVARFKEKEARSWTWVAQAVCPHP